MYILSFFLILPNTVCGLRFVAGSVYQRNPTKMENKDKYLLCFTLFCFFCSTHGLCREYFKENNYFTNADDSKPTIKVIFEKFVSIDYIHTLICITRAVIV